MKRDWTWRITGGVIILLLYWKLQIGIHQFIMLGIPAQEIKNPKHSPFQTETK